MYIGNYNMKSFLEPLSREEEQIYIERMQKGDLEARNTLVLRNMRLVAHIAKKYQSQEDSLDDLISIGTYGLIKAIMTFDSEKGNKLAAYSSRCIENEMLMYMRSKKKSSKEISMYEKIGTDKEGNQLRLMDVLDSGEEDLYKEYERKDIIELLKQNIKNILNLREYEVIKRRYGLEGEEAWTQQEISDEFLISRSYVSRIEKKALRKLRQYFES